MTKINQDYIYTDEWDDINRVTLQNDSLYLYAHDPEDRSVFCAQALKSHNLQTVFAEICFNDQDDTFCIVGKEDTVISLHSNNQLDSFLTTYKNSVVYLEVTGLSCRVAAPLLKYAMDNHIEMRIVYAEPAKYILDEFRKMGSHQDLSESVRGIYPLPGLTNILPHRESPLFVVLLGFEGGRFSQIIQDQSPDNDKITPVLGVPGYRIDYPYFSLWGNRNQIRNTTCWQRIKYAEANSIVDIYMMLKQLSYDTKDSEMVVAPIGTKPHAIGAILYSIKHHNKVEIVYDNPKRSVHRTDGIGKVLVCNVTKLFDEN